MVLWRVSFNNSSADRTPWLQMELQLNEKAPVPAEWCIHFLTLPASRKSCLCIVVGEIHFPIHFGIRINEGIVFVEPGLGGDLEFFNLYPFNEVGIDGQRTSFGCIVVVIIVPRPACAQRFGFPIAGIDGQRKCCLFQEIEYRLVFEIGMQETWDHRWAGDRWCLRLRDNVSPVGCHQGFSYPYTGLRSWYCWRAQSIFRPGSYINRFCRTKGQISICRYGR